MGRSFLQNCLMSRVILFFMTACGLSSCIPNSKVTYLQKDDVTKKNLPVDTVVRAYPVGEFDYKIQPNDVLNIHFGSLTDDKYDFLNKMQEASTIGGGAQGAGYIVNGYLVDSEGYIAFPVVNKVKVGGLNVFQVQEQLQQIADQYLEAPSVRVRLVNFRFTVLGEVRLEGTNVTFNNRVTLLEGLGLAGGLDQYADRSKIKLIRTVGDKREVAYINLLDEHFVNSPYYYLYQNDILIVPPLKQRQYRKYFGQNLALILSTLTLAALIVSISQK